MSQPPLKVSWAARGALICKEEINGWVMPVDRGEEPAGVFRDYQTLALSLAASKLPGNTTENTNFLDSAC